VPADDSKYDNIGLQIFIGLCWLSQYTEADGIFLLGVKIPNCLTVRSSDFFLTVQLTCNRLSFVGSKESAKDSRDDNIDIQNKKSTEKFSAF
jgi:hypothetical protein